MENKDIPEYVLINLNYVNLFHQLSFEEAGKMFLAVVDKYKYKKTIDIKNDYTRAITDTWCNDIDNALTRMEEKRKQLSERGKKGAEGLWNGKRKKQPSQPDIPFVEAEELERYPFEEFWDLYDRKTHTMECKKLWRRLSDEDKAQIMAHVPQYVAATPEKRYRRDPYNYLCKRGWEDEIITPQSNEIYNVQPNNREVQRQRNMLNAMQCVLDAAANVKPFDTPTE